MVPASNRRTSGEAPDSERSLRVPRIIGIFAVQHAANGVVEQLKLNGIDRTTMLRSSDQTLEPAESAAAAAQALHTVRLPEKQAAEYRARL